MTRYYEIIEAFIDDYGLIANVNNDEGDSANREGSFAICVAELYNQDKIGSYEYLSLRGRYFRNLAKLSCGKGGLYRGLVPGSWFNQDCVMSRDQWTPNVIACGMLGLKAERRYLFLGHLSRLLLFTTNTCPNEVLATKDNWKLPDLTALSSWGFYIRAYRFWLLYPLLLIFDLELLVNSLIIVYNSHYYPKDTDVINHVNATIQAKRNLPTGVSYLARQALKLDKRGMQACLDDYFRPELNGPPLNKVYADILPDVLK